ncbi:MAG: hypothetical protein PHR64_00595 [Candidatus Shapirobacteria bacterium]|nr:hypothetical protein [Candidatus Shapirobacteria bacterium]MDD5073673.1 hypothetical protein [Candidatus Shapirobacteria bacterium]MDD5481435.1 hypothetical protein [Candidatus Shapirobacteria bacterium]
MANPERNPLDQLARIYGHSQTIVGVRPATPLEIQERILTSQDRKAPLIIEPDCLFSTRYQEAVTSY